LLSKVRHLWLADCIIVIGADGRIAEQGTFETLRSQNGFVGKLLFDPELKPYSGPGPSYGGDSMTRPSATIPHVLRGAPANNAADLARRTGDFSVYKYYLRSIGWKIALVCIASCSASMIGLTFPRKCTRIQCKG
jgi:ATP-binding cassette subfamily C (CFTR/MRP) protein 1